MWIATKIGFYEMSISCGSVKVLAKTLEELENFAKLASEATGRNVKVFHAHGPSAFFREEIRFPENRKVVLDNAELGVVLNLLAYTIDYHDFLEALQEQEHMDEYFIQTFSHRTYHQHIHLSREQAHRRLKEVRLKKNKLEYEKHILNEKLNQGARQRSELTTRGFEIQNKIRKIEKQLADIEGRKPPTPHPLKAAFSRAWKSIFGSENS